MKTILWATLSANGNYARATPASPPKPEALADFAALTSHHGNFIVGRKTFEEFQSRPERRPAVGGAVVQQADVVVVSRTLTLPAHAPVQRASDPRAALAFLRERNHGAAVIVGGESLHNAFLEADLVDELVVVIAPTFEDEGLKLRLRRGELRSLELLDQRSLGGGVMRLHYALRDRRTWDAPAPR